MNLLFFFVTRPEKSCSETIFGILAPSPNSPAFQQFQLFLRVVSEIMLDMDESINEPCPKNFVGW